MGPSGSGKTTLLNIMAGIDRPDSGRVVINGIELQTLSERELTNWRANNIGFVFQFYNLIPVLTALENVALPLTLLPFSAAERAERAKFALSIVGLGERVNHLPSQLSGGQEQRVAIARSIVTDPTVLIADEPTGDLDRASAQDVMALLKRLNHEFGKTICMVTHDTKTAEYASRIVNLDKGRLK
jgi:putative ABC transport system ATP-binding protein